MFFTMKCNDGTVKYCCQTLKNAAMKEANCHKHYTSRIYIYIYNTELQNLSGIVYSSLPTINL